MAQDRKELEAIIERLRKEALQHGAEKVQWLYERAALMRVIFQLSDALQYEKTH
jgi:hypothetical protein